VCLPAGSWDKTIPYSRKRRALDPDEKGAKAHGNVHRDDDEPDKPLDLAFGESEECKGETRLGPDGCGEGQGAGGVDELDHGNDLFVDRRPVIPELPVAEGGRVRQAGGFGSDANLEIYLLVLVHCARCITSGQK